MSSTAAATTAAPLPDDGGSCRSQNNSTLVSRLTRKEILQGIGHASYGSLALFPATDVGKALSSIFEREAAAAV